MRNYEVSVSFLSETNIQLIRKYVVRSKSPRFAITNVLTNKHKGNVSRVDVKEVEVYYMPAE